ALPRALARAGVRVRTLSSHRKIPAMAQSAVALNLDEPPDVHLHLLAEIALDAALGLDCGAQTRHFLFGQVLDLLRRVHIRLFSERTRARLPDAVNGRQSDPKALVRRQIHTRDTCHLIFSLALTLPVLWIDANHAHHSAPVNDLALHANFLNRCP